MRPRITNNGLSMQIRSMYGDTISFTRMKMGNGAKPQNYLTINDLVNPLVSVGFTDYTIGSDEYILLEGVFNNNNLASAFYWTEIGIFVEDPDNAGQELLYAYGHCELEPTTEVAATIPKTGDEIYEIKLTYRVYVGEADNLNVELAESSIYATQADFEAHTGDTTNPHQVTKSQVGLGNVPNVATDDQTPTVTTASTLDNLVAGDTLRTIIGKISKAIGDFISHLANNVMHVTAAERTAWNAKANGTHYHSTSDITSGSLSVDRGGTGASSARNAMVNLAGNTAIKIAGLGYLDTNKVAITNAEGVLVASTITKAELECLHGVTNDIALDISNIQSALFTVYYGTADPTSSAGQDGDLYIKLSV